MRIASEIIGIDPRVGTRGPLHDPIPRWQHTSEVGNFLPHDSEIRGPLGCWTGRCWGEGYVGTLFIPRTHELP